jgi:hypothetical protein
MERWLARFTWDRIFVLLIFILLAGPSLASWILSFKVPKSTALVVALLVVVIKLLGMLPPAWRRFGAASGKGLGAQIAALVPPSLIGWIKLDRGYWQAFFVWVRRRPALPAPPAGQHIGFLKNSQYTTVLAMVFISCLVDLPVSAMIIGVVEKDPVIQNRIHLVMLAMTFYTLVWVFADRWLIKASHHVLGASHLHLRVGSRLQADIPLAAIARAERMSESVKQWKERLGLEDDAFIKVSPLDSPNLLLTLDGSVPAKVERYKTMLAAPRYLLVYVDDPQWCAQLLRRKELNVSE